MGTDGQGLSGLEYKYNNLLEGKPGKLVEDMDPAGGQIPGGLQQYQAPVRGDDLVLSVDEPLQYDTEEALARAIVAAQADSGMALIMGSHTGDLLAVAQSDHANGVCAVNDAGAPGAADLVRPARRAGHHHYSRATTPRWRAGQRRQCPTRRGTIRFSVYYGLRAGVGGKAHYCFGRTFDWRNSAQ